MPNRLVAVAAFVVVGQFLATFLYGGILTAEGIPRAGNDARLQLTNHSAHPILYGIYVFDLVAAIAYLLLVLGFDQRFGSTGTPVRRSVLFVGLAACALITAASIVSMAGFIWLDSVYVSQPSMALQSYPRFDLTMKLLLGAGRFCLGLWLVLVGIIVRQKRQLPSWVAYLGIILGAGLMVAVAVPAVFVVTVLFLPWAGSVGVLMWRGDGINRSELAARSQTSDP